MDEEEARHELSYLESVKDDHPKQPYLQTARCSCGLELTARSSIDAQRARRNLVREHWRHLSNLEVE